jgi:CBS domain-containing protein
VRIAFKFRKTSFKAAPNGKRASKRDRLLPIAQQKLIRIIDSAELIDAAKLLRDRDTEIVAVCTPDGVPAGVITKTDVVGQISHCQDQSCTTPASPAMTRDVIVRKAGQLLGDVWSIMKKRKLKNIPVVDAESRPIGMLNARDTLQLLLKEAQDEELLLRDYVMCVGYH